VSEPALALDSVEKRYHAVRALRGVSLSVERGARVRLVGANGAGKSTLLRIAAGLTRPTRGRVEVLGGSPLGRDGALRRARIGFLGQHPGLYAELTLEENLRFQARLLGLPAERVPAAIASLELEPIARQTVGTLSLGYRRRAGLARTLLAEPDLLLLDEPWNGLDQRSADALAKRLDLERARGATTVVATHTAAVPEGYFDATVELEAGSLARAQGRGVSLG
jgi:ABC-type multidrug transport system ATPase subunit